MDSIDAESCIRSSSISARTTKSVIVMQQASNLLTVLYTSNPNIRCPCDCEIYGGS